MQCPLLCKEFVIDVWQIYYARSKGADAILLIAAVLPDIDITYFLGVCKSLGMTALVEVILPPSYPTISLSYFFLHARFSSFTVNLIIICTSMSMTIASFQNKGCNGILLYKV
jgi:hypothetical protein